MLTNNSHHKWNHSQKTLCLFIFVYFHTVRFISSFPIYIYIYIYIYIHKQKLWNLYISSHTTWSYSRVMRSFKVMVTQDTFSVKIDYLIYLSHFHLNFLYSRFSLLYVILWCLIMIINVCSIALFICLHSYLISRIPISYK